MEAGRWWWRGVRWGLGWGRVRRAAGRRAGGWSGGGRVGNAKVCPPVGHSGRRALCGWSCSPRAALRMGVGRGGGKPEHLARTCQLCILVGMTGYTGGGVARAATGKISFLSVLESVLFVRNYLMLSKTFLIFFGEKHFVGVPKKMQIFAPPPRVCRGYPGVLRYEV